MLETRYGFTRKTFSDMKLLTKGLRGIFGTGSNILLKAIAEQLRSTNPVPAEALAALQDAAGEIEEALYGVENGLG